MSEVQSKLVEAVLLERKRQDSLWGEQNHPPYYWTGILGEEFGELCEAVNESVFDNGTDKGGYDNMRTEATHVAAVALGFLECLERNKSSWFEELEPIDLYSGCVACGVEIPEGRMVCPLCEARPLDVKRRERKLP